jgi:signal transduction histidine kinase
MAQDRDKPASIAHIWAQAAHDLRQPVQAALLLAGGLDASAAPAELKRNAKHIDSALRSLDEMLEILIALSRIEAGVLMQTVRLCDVADVLEPVMQEAAQLAERRGHRLSVGKIAGKVRSHPKLLTVAARGLLITAMEFTDGPEIGFTCRRGGDEVRLEAEFAGARIDAQVAKRAFVQLAPARGNCIDDGALGLGPVLLEHVCRVLGHTFEHGEPAPGRRQLALVLPASS